MNDEKKMVDDILSEEAYEQFADKVLDEMDPGDIVTWKVFTSWAGMKAPDQENNGAWRLYVGARNILKNSFNDFCLIHRWPYKLFIQDQGISLILKEKEDMAITEQVRVTKQIGRRLKNIQKDFILLAKSERLKKRTRDSLRAMSAASMGLQMTLLGSLDHFALPTQEKKQLQAFLTPQFREEEDEDGN